jgi:hypothetical protein
VALEAVAAKVGAVFAAKSGQHRHVAAVTPTFLHSLPATAAATAATYARGGCGSSVVSFGETVEAWNIDGSSDDQAESGSWLCTAEKATGAGGARSTGAPIKPK